MIVFTERRFVDFQFLFQIACYRHILSSKTLFQLIVKPIKTSYNSKFDDRDTISETQKPKGEREFELEVENDIF